MKNSLSAMNTLQTVRRFLPLGVALATLPGCYLFCPYNVDQFVETQIRAECHFWFSCCTAGEHANAAAAGRFGDLARFKDEGACVQERLEEGTEANDFVLGVQQAESAGRFKFDVAAFQLCQQPAIDALDSCNADFVLGDGGPRVTPDECQELPPGTGLVVDGRECFFAYECAIPGSDCLDPAVLEAFNPDDEPEDPVRQVITQPKVCIKPIEEGDSCELDEDHPFLPATCEPGTICFFDDGQQTCELVKQEGDACNADSDCDVGLFCNGDFECEALKQDGDACDFDAECDAGLFCDLADANPECTADLPVEVEICNGVNGATDPVYPNQSTN